MSQPSRGPALLAFGFRPFFLFAGLLAAVWLPLWLTVHAGQWRAGGHLGPLSWHGHEMLFGYATAVIAGFLLTATTNWTGQVTARGPALALLCLLWLAGRLTLLADPGVGPWPAVALDVAFLPALALVVLRPIWRTGNRRNLGLPLLLLLLAAANLGAHLGALGLAPWAPERPLWLALDVVVLLMVVIGGRVVPSFTANAVPAARIHARPALDRAAIVLTALVIPAELVSAAAAAWLALAAGLANAGRLAGWGGAATLRQPILWVLHLGYLWLVAGLVLRGLAAGWDAIPTDAAMHALAVGAIGTLTLGMMSRVALGHTGRPLVVARPIVAAYLALTAAALLRLTAAFLDGDAYQALLYASGSLWTVAFALFVLLYAPILARPRPDGRPG